MTTELTKSHPRQLPAPHEYARHVERIADCRTARSRLSFIGLYFLTLLAFGLVGAVFAYCF